MNKYRRDPHGTWWPAADTQCSAVVPNQVADMDTALQFVPKDRRTCCVQAGGNVGLWGIRLSMLFDTVFIFEPDADNYECMTRNMGGVEELDGPFIYAAPCALGEFESRASLNRDPSNVGAHTVCQGDEFDVVRLDDVIPLLDDVSYLQLDVEGYEWQALKGGAQLIERCEPVIQLELKGIGKRYGYEDSEVFSWLAERGYREAARVHRDVIFVPVS